MMAAALALVGCEEQPVESDPVERARAELAADNPLEAEVWLQRALAAGTAPAELAALLGEAALLEGDLATARKWLAPGKFSPETFAQGYRMLGRLELAQGNLAAAGQAFDLSLATGPASAPLWVDIGRLRYRGGEQLEAIEAAEHALSLDPANAEALHFRGQLLRDSEGLETGASFFAAALRRQPRSATLRVEYAATLADAGRAREALAVLRRGGSRAAESSRGLFVEAVIAARGKEFFLARELLQRSGFERDGMPAAVLLSAIVDLAQENYASAAQQLDRLHQQQPDNSRVSDLLALALARSGGERELVHRFAEKAASPTGSPYLRTMVGRALETLGDRTGAARFLDLAANPRSAMAPLPSQAPPETLGFASGGGGAETRDFVRDAIARRQTTAAVRRARDFARRHPGSGDAYVLLGDAELAHGNKRAAREAYQESAQVRRPWSLVLRLARAQGDSQAAREILEGYVRENPQNGQAAAILADAYAAQGDWQRAVQMLDHAIGLGMARVPWVRAARSVGAGELGDREAALDHARAAHELQPLNPLAIAALIAALPDGETAARARLQAKLASLGTR